MHKSRFMSDLQIIGLNILGRNRTLTIKMTILG